MFICNRLGNKNGHHNNLHLYNNKNCRQGYKNGHQANKNGCKGNKYGRQGNKNVHYCNLHNHLLAAANVHFQGRPAKIPNQGLASGQAEYEGTQHQVAHGHGEK